MMKVDYWCLELLISTNFLLSLSLYLSFFLTFCVCLSPPSLSLYFYLYLSLNFYLYLSPTLFLPLPLLLSLTLFLSLPLSLYFYLYLYLSLFQSISISTSLSLSLFLSLSLSSSLFKALYLFKLSLSLFHFPTSSIQQNNSNTRFLYHCSLTQFDGGSIEIFLPLKLYLQRTSSRTFLNQNHEWFSSISGWCNWKKIRSDYTMRCDGLEWRRRGNVCEKIIFSCT